MILGFYKQALSLLVVTKNFEIEAKEALIL